MIASLLTETEAREHVASINAAVNDIGRRLLDLRDREGWKVLGYHSFTAMLGREFAYSRQYLYQLMAAAPVQERLSTIVDNLSTHAAAALSQFDAELQPVIARSCIARYGKLTESNVNVLGDQLRTLADSGQAYDEEGEPLALEMALTAADVEKVKRQQGYIHDNGAKPKSNYAAPEGETHPKDFCQTPDYALDPILLYVPLHWRIWEPAEGEGLLVDALYDSDFQTVITGDIRTGQDYYQYEPDNYDCQITNPPFSDKYIWLERAYALGKPFALLMPIDTLGAKTAQSLFEAYGVEIICMNQRVDFKMPNKGWEGDAQFNSAWFTWQLCIGKQITFANITEAKQRFEAALREEYRREQV